MHLLLLNMKLVFSIYVNEPLFRSLIIYRNGMNEPNEQTYLLTLIPPDTVTLKIMW